jgi:type IV pilus assembly protein PilC
MNDFEQQLPPQQKGAKSARIKFEYLAMDGNGRELRGTIMAADDIEAVAKLKKQKLFPIEVWKSRTRRAKEKKVRSAAPPRRDDHAVSQDMSKGARFLRALGVGHVLKAKILCMFTRQLATMLDAGLPLLLSLRTLYEQCGKSFRYRSLKKILAELVSHVESGMALSEALLFHPRSFSKLYTGLVRAGEASGAMEEVLGRLADYIEKTERMKKKIKAGMTYPLVVLTIAIAITLGLMIGVVPKFAEMFDEILEGIPLPLLTQFVITISNLLMNHVWAVFGTIFGAAILVRVMVGTRVGKYAFDWWLINMPPFSGLVRKIAIGRFCSTLGTLLDAGVPILDALQIAEDTATNEIMATTVRRVHMAVAEGERVATPLEMSRIISGMVVRMIDVGEQTGALPDMLKRIARTFEEEVEATLEALISLIEPIMICFLAVIIGGIVLALFLPLIKIIETLGV